MSFDQKCWDLAEHFLAGRGTYNIEKRRNALAQDIQEAIEDFLRDDVGDPPAPPPPVDRSQQQLVSGAPVPADRSHTAPKPNGQQRDYVVLSDAERAKGFVRQVRRSYTHLKCGGLTTMGQALAETYARDPSFYSGTFCCDCGAHFPVGEDGEFVWAGTTEKVGT